MAPSRLQTAVRPLPRLEGRFDRGFALALLLSLLVATPLLDNAFFFKAHDAPHSIFYLVEFDQSIRDGAIWPRWQPDFAFGYGYPLFDVYSPLAFFVAEGFVLAGLGFVGAVKAATIIAIIGSAAAAYLLGRRLAGPVSGVLTAAAYTFLPYHLTDLYVRSAFAECFALMWLPLTLWAFLRLEGQPDGDDAFSNESKLAGIVRLPTKRAIAIAGLSLAGVVLSHNATALLFAPFLLLFLAWRLLERLVRRDRLVEILRLIWRWMVAGFLALGLATVFWLPLVVEGKYLKLDEWTRAQFDFSQHFVFPHQFLSPYWGFGYSGPGPDDTMGFQLGLAGIVLAAFAVASSPVGVSARARRTSYFFASVAGLLALVMTPIAAPVWTVLPGASLVQFPWRIEVLTLLTVAPLAGLAVAGLETRFGDGASALRAVVPLLAAVVVTGSPYIRAESTPIVGDNVSPKAVILFEQKSSTGSTVYAERLPTTSPMVDQYLADQVPRKWRLDEGVGQVEQTRHGGEAGEARVRVPAGGRLVYQTYDFPGWTMRVDGQVVEHGRSGPFGLIAVDLPPGDHVVSARFETTPVRTVAAIVSVVALLLTVFLLAKRK